MDIMTALLPKGITTPVPADDRRISPASEMTLKNTCTALLSPLYAPVAKPISRNNTIQHLENSSSVWERTAKPLDFSDYFTYAKKILIESGTAAGNNMVHHPYVNNSLYYNHLINGGGSFNHSVSSVAMEHGTDGGNGKGDEGQQHTLYSVAFSKPLVIPSAWSSLEDLTTPTTATSSSAATSRCSTPATNGWTFVERPPQADLFIVQDPSDAAAAQQRDVLKSRPSSQNLQALKKRTSMNSFTSNSSELTQSPPLDGHSVISNQQQPKVRRSSNTTIISDTTSENSEKSAAIELEKEQKKATLYKTEMCRNWEERGSCRLVVCGHELSDVYGNKCQFAHSENELRKITHHPKYKTEICKTFWQNGTCPYGKRCCFIHNDKNGVLRRNSSENLKNSGKSNGSKSKGLSKFCSDPALYGSYVNDSASPVVPVPPPSMASTQNVPSTSNSDSLRAFTDAYFSGQAAANQGSPESVDGNPSSTIEKESSNVVTGVHRTAPANSISNSSNAYDQENCIFEEDEDNESNFPTSLTDKPLILNETINDFGSIPIPPDMYATKFDKVLRPQTRRRASTTSCRLDKAAISSSTTSTTVTNNTVLRERSVSMSVNANMAPAPSNSNNLVPVVGHNRGRRLAIFRNLG
ncbi:4057_t:CDS:2 [Acaulospora morrowiae]|uniref:4057_t:CDS:1 n=1 Tax=Acaulospora morrowiae TaxID=94023 RepID=A0A9N9GYL8_9GLOM|nr:4057_t:CDS:2 [Acaulospora morrowiae]